jgi:hypothetical protein
LRIDAEGDEMDIKAEENNGMNGGIDDAAR